MEKILMSWLVQHRRLAVIIVVGLLGVLSLGLGLSLALHRSSAPADPALASSQAVATSSPLATHTTNRAVASSKSSNATKGPMYVDVKGAVNHPGVYEVSERMRVADVIALAKGLRPKADRVQLNLAEKVTDQQVIYVPVKGEKPPVMSNHNSTGVATTKSATPNSTNQSTAGSASSQTANEDPINLNTANVTDLQKLAGVGQKKAEKIIEYRETHDGFKSVDDLKQVSGIGDKTLAKFRNQLTV